MTEIIFLTSFLISKDFAISIQATLMSTKRALFHFLTVALLALATPIFAAEEAEDLLREKQPLNAARVLASKFALSQYAVEDMDYVLEYNLYNVGDRTALRVTLDDRNSFPTQSFDVVKGMLHVRWEKLAPGENVTHSVIVRPRNYGVFNYTSAIVTYYATNDAKQVTVGYSTAPGEGNIYRLKDYERRFASKLGVWIIFLLLALPTTAVPFFLWYKYQQKYSPKGSTGGQAPKKVQ